MRKETAPEGIRYGLATGLLYARISSQLRVRPLRRFLVSWESDFRLLHLSMRGISVLSGMPRVFEALIPGAEVEEQEKLSNDLREARREAELAENELRMGFPLLHAHALVAMWSALDAAIEDMLVGILLNEPDVLRKDVFAKLRVPLAEFELKDKEERARFLLAEIGRTLGRRNGVDAFECVLACFDLSGKVDEGTKKVCWETHHMRYVLTLTHRSGKRYNVDTHGLIERAPKKNKESQGNSKTSKTPTDTGGESVH